jgi:hypothetical protein
MRLSTRLLHPATLGSSLGLALALGATGAQAQDVIAQNVFTRQIDNAPVETTVTQTPGGTVITRRPLAPAFDPAQAATTATVDEIDETVGVAPVRRPAARIGAPVRAVHRDRHQVRRIESKSTVRTTRRVTAPLVLDPAQRQVVYRTIVQQQIVPPPGYPPFPAPAYRADPRTVVVPPATTGYAVTTRPDVDEVYDDDVDVAQLPPEPVPVRYAVGARLPAGLAPLPLPATAAVEVPSVRAYNYVRVGGRVLLVDPATNTVVADITP